MGLSSTLSNALGGMNASQRGIDVVSRNIANQGTPGYHRQSLVIQETAFGTSAQVRATTLSRAFNEALEKQHLVAVSSAGYSHVRASYLDRLQMHLGQPGDANSLDTLYSGFENALQSLATNPNDVTTRAAVINSAQQLVEQLNTLNGAVSEMRRETELQIGNAVSELNRQLNQLSDINVRILDLSQDQQARLSLMDERDRLVASISEQIDVRASYRADGTVALMTESGVGILDVEPSQFVFNAAGPMADSSSAVGQLTLRTPSGLQMDMKPLLSSGSIAGLMELRDNTLVNMSDQLDEIASGLALALNSDDASGLELDLFVDGATGTYDEADKTGFAGRIRVNEDIISDSTLLVKYASDTSLGDPARPQFLLDRLKTMEFVSDKVTSVADGGVRLSGKVGEIIAQMINNQGNVVAKAQSENSAVGYTLESITTRMGAEYGVNVDEEMARLMQLQNAYSASARVVSTVQELIDALLRM
jgi:flagellar hook-associated protein FlgK